MLPVPGSMYASADAGSKETRAATDIRIQLRAACGRPEADLCGILGADADAAEVDHQPGFAGGQQLGRQRAAHLLEDGVAVASATEADEQQPAGAAPLGDEGLCDRRGVTLEALRLGRAGCERAGGFVEAAQPVRQHVLAADGDRQRIGTARTGIGEGDFHGGALLANGGCRKPDRQRRLDCKGTLRPLQRNKGNAIGRLVASMCGRAKLRVL